MIYFLHENPAMCGEILKAYKPEKLKEALEELCYSVSEVLRRAKADNEFLFPEQENYDETELTFIAINAGWVFLYGYYMVKLVHGSNSKTPESTKCRGLLRGLYDKFKIKPFIPVKGYIDGKMLDYRDCITRTHKACHIFEEVEQ